MTMLATFACAIGGLLMAGNTVAVVAPDFFRRLLQDFPRSRMPAWILVAVDLFWVFWVMLHASLGWFDPWKWLLYPALPLAFFLIIFFMDELLAPRALGGLLLLVANPILTAARWPETPWRLVMTVLAYVWVVAGMVLVLSPYRFRHLVEFVNRTTVRTRLGGVARFLVGALLLFLGLKVY